MKIVAFLGPKQSGKDTAADLLKKKGKVKSIVRFAGPLKKVCAAATGLSEQHFVNVVLKEKELDTPVVATRKFWRLVKGEMVKHLSEVNEYDEMIYNIDRVNISGVENRVFKTPREILQQVGTDFIRQKVYSDWHVKAAFSDANLEKYEGNHRNAVTDCRFKNEYDFLKEKFGDDIVFFYVERPEAEEKVIEISHSSELEILELKKLIPEENIIKNDGSLEDFESKILKLELPKVSRKKKAKSSKAKKATKDGKEINRGFVYGKRR